jgi:hypothetical protein
VRGEFDVLAVNCYAFEEQWQFVFARNSDLPASPHKGYTAEQQRWLNASLIPVTWPPLPPFHLDLPSLLDTMIKEGKGRDPETL